MDPALAAQISEAVAEKVLQYRRDKSGWKICREGNGVSVSWRPSVEFPGNLYRGEGVVNGTPEKVWDCIKPVAGSLREQWDENVSRFEIIQSITDAGRFRKKDMGVASSGHWSPVCPLESAQVLLGSHAHLEDSDPKVKSFSATHGATSLNTQREKTERDFFQSLLARHQASPRPVPAAGLTCASPL
ncbi:stAR-related lipid transfer protein 5 isoform X2 [Diceros bicornis minor]|uniref:stAR-related lipid transfer protein 5 isoform X2 n=1 Tax=Diceros bicornis minor TaxID=77932 RepID=UPI0026F28CC5|nr:stAR-related lipid transfer protein 5 isoform X2 [Diceros bicornis minor]